MEEIGVNIRKLLVSNNLYFLGADYCFTIIRPKTGVSSKKESLKSRWKRDFSVVCLTAAFFLIAFTAKGIPEQQAHSHFSCCCPECFVALFGSEAFLPNVAFNALILRKPFSGVTYSVLRLLQALVKLDKERNYRVLIPRAVRGDLPKQDNIKTFSPWFVSGHSPKSRVFYEQAVLPFSIAGLSANYAHFPAYVAPRLLFIPFIVTIHDLISLTHPALCKSSTVMHFKFALKRAIEKAARIVVPSNTVKKELLRLFSACPSEKVSVTPFAAVHPPARLSRKAAKRLLNERYDINFPFFLFVGNIEPKKNLPTLLKSFFAAKMKRNFRHKLVIIGRKGWKYDKEDLLYKTLAMDEMVHELGYVDEENLPLFYRAATALCFPSLVEGFGLPVIEAMQEGCPCLLSDIPVFREIASDCAEFLPLVDIEKWRLAIEDAALGAFAGKTLEERRMQMASTYSWERTAKLTMDVYTSLERELYG